MIATLYILIVVLCFIRLMHLTRELAAKENAMHEARRQRQPRHA